MSYPRDPSKRVAFTFLWAWGLMGMATQSARAAETAPESERSAKPEDVPARRDPFVRYPDAQEGRSPGTFQSGLPLFKAPEELLLPTRLIESPTGEILPSLHFAAGSGSDFGLSNQNRTGRWVVSFGLGGVAEVMVASHRIVHVSVPESDALAGFRMKLPVRWMGSDVGDHLSLAVNVAATTDGKSSSSSAITRYRGQNATSLMYDYRETTIGVAGTWRAGRARFHGLLHATDLRVENMLVHRNTDVVQAGDQRKTYPSIGLGFDYRVNPQTYFLSELRTVPKLTFQDETAGIRVGGKTEFATGVRFFLGRAVSLDAIVSIDEDALGIADTHIGLGANLLFGVGPRETSQN